MGGTITEPETFQLENSDKTLVTVYPVNDVGEVNEGLVQYMCDVFNKEIERGDTYPQDTKYTLEEFKEYWFHYFVVLMFKGEPRSLLESRDWETEYLGTFYIKPNYVGVCSHNCNAGFVVNPLVRGQRIGYNLGKVYLKWAPILGYTYSVFNLVFETNVASVKIWDSLGFDRVGKIKQAGYLKPYGRKVDLIIFGKDLV